MARKVGNPIAPSVGAPIRPLRRRLKMSQADLGEVLGVTFQQIQNAAHTKNHSLRTQRRSRRSGSSARVQKWRRALPFWLRTSFVICDGDRRDELPLRSTQERSGRTPGCRRIRLSLRKRSSAGAFGSHAIANMWAITIVATTAARKIGQTRLSSKA